MQAWGLYPINRQQEKLIGRQKCPNRGNRLVSTFGETYPSGSSSDEGPRVEGVDIEYVLDSRDVRLTTKLRD